jgi:hypothetical protein
MSKTDELDPEEERWWKANMREVFLKTRTFPPALPKEKLPNPDVDQDLWRPGSPEDQ